MENHLLKPIVILSSEIGSRLTFALTCDGAFLFRARRPQVQAGCSALEYKLFHPRHGAEPLRFAAADDLGDFVLVRC
jgi:hypothetical protein